MGGLTTALLLSICLLPTIYVWIVRDQDVLLAVEMDRSLTAAAVCGQGGDQCRELRLLQAVNRLVILLVRVGHVRLPPQCPAAAPGNTSSPGFSGYFAPSGIGASISSLRITSVEVS